MNGIGHVDRKAKCRFFNPKVMSSNPRCVDIRKQDILPEFAPVDSTQ